MLCSSSGINYAIGKTKEEKLAWPGCVVHLLAIHPELSLSPLVVLAASVCG